MVGGEFPVHIHASAPFVILRKKRVKKSFGKIERKGQELTEPLKCKVNIWLRMDSRERARESHCHV